MIMIDFIKIDNKIDKITEIVDYKYMYKLNKDNKTIGYGTINNDEENGIFIYIEKESRGNGYGRELFLKILEEMKKEGYKEVKIIFNRENIQMLKIVTKEGGLHISSMDENVQYVVPIK